MSHHGEGKYVWGDKSKEQMEMEIERRARQKEVNMVESFKTIGWGESISEKTCQALRDLGWTDPNQIQEIITELSQAKATMLVNFGPEGKEQPKLVTGDENLNNMIVKVLLFYTQREDQLLIHEFELNEKETKTNKEQIKPSYDHDYVEITAMGDTCHTFRCMKCGDEYLIPMKTE